MRKSHLKAAGLGRGREEDKRLGTKKPETLGTGAGEASEAAGEGRGGEVKNRRLGWGSGEWWECTSRDGESDGSRVSGCGGGSVAFGFGRVCGACAAVIRRFRPRRVGARVHLLPRSVTP